MRGHALFIVILFVTSAAVQIEVTNLPPDYPSSDVIVNPSFNDYDESNLIFSWSCDEACQKRLAYVRFADGQNTQVVAGSHKSILLPYSSYERCGTYQSNTSFVLAYNNSLWQEEITSKFIVVRSPTAPSNVSVYESQNTPFAKWTAGSCDCATDVTSAYYHLTITIEKNRYYANTTLTYHNLTTEASHGHIALEISQVCLYNTSQVITSSALKFETDLVSSKLGWWFWPAVALASSMTLGGIVCFVLGLLVKSETKVYQHLAGDVPLTVSQPTLVFSTNDNFMNR